MDFFATIRKDQSSRPRNNCGPWERSLTLKDVIQFHNIVEPPSTRRGLFSRI